MSVAMAQAALIAYMCCMSRTGERTLSGTYYRWQSDKKRPIWDILVMPPNIDLDCHGTDQFQSHRVTTHSHVMKDHSCTGCHAQH